MAISTTLFNKIIAGVFPKIESQFRTANASSGFANMYSPSGMTGTLTGYGAGEGFVYNSGDAYYKGNSARSSRIVLSNNNFLNNKSKVTLVIRHKPFQWSDTEILHRFIGSQAELSFWTFSNRFAIQVSDGTNTFLYNSAQDISPPAVPTGTDVYSIIVFDGTQATNADKLKMYTNKTLRSSTYTSGTCPATIGNPGSTGTEYMFGRSYNSSQQETTMIALFDDALTQLEIDELVDAGPDLGGMVATDLGGGLYSLSDAVTQYNLEYSAGANGSLIGTTSQVVNHGSSGTAVTAVPSEGYMFDQWSDSSKQNPRIDANVQANITVSASFKLEVFHDVTISTVSNGTTNITGVQSVLEGSDLTITSIADSNYRLKKWIVPNGIVSTSIYETSITLSNISSDITIAPEFESDFGIHPKDIIFGVIPAIENNERPTSSNTANPLVVKGGKALSTITATLHNFSVGEGYVADGMYSKYRFDGIDSHIRFLPLNALDGRSSFFMHFAVDYNDYSQSGILMSRYIDDTHRILVQNIFGNLNVSIDNGAENVFNGVFSLTNNLTPLHIGKFSIQLDGAQTGINRIKFYYNGLPIAFDSYTGVPPASTSSGSDGVNNTLGRTSGVVHNGNIYQYIIAERVYTDAEVLDLCNRPLDLNFFGSDNEDGTMTIYPKEVSAFVIRHDNVDSTFSGISNDRAATIITKNKMFWHASIGRIIMGRLLALGQSNPTFDIDIVPQWDDYQTNVTLSDYQNFGPILGHVNSIGDFVAKVDECNSELSLVMKKYCYVNIYAGGPTAQTIFNGYKNEIDYIKATYPNIKIVHFTMPLTTDEDALNAERSKYRDMLINEYGTDSNSVIIDIAEMSSWYDGAHTTFEVNGETHLKMNQANTYDYGHPTQVFADFLAKAVWGAWDRAINGAQDTPVVTRTLEYIAGANGSITGDQIQLVNQGESGTQVTAVPSLGYEFDGWSDGIITASRTDTNVQDDITVTANFVIRQFTVNYSAGSNGSIVGNANQTVNYGEDATTITAIPNEGYDFNNWSDGVLTPERTDTNITANLNVTANIEEKQPMTYYLKSTGSNTAPYDTEEKATSSFNNIRRLPDFAATDTVTVCSDIDITEFDGALYTKFCNMVAKEGLAEIPTIRYRSGAGPLYQGTGEFILNGISFSHENPGAPLFGGGAVYKATRSEFRIPNVTSTLTFSSVGNESEFRQCLIEDLRTTRSQSFIATGVSTDDVVVDGCTIVLSSTSNNSTYISLGENATITNNIIYCPDEVNPDDPFYISAESFASIRNNIVFSGGSSYLCKNTTTSALTNGTNAIIADPLFAETVNYTLSTNSPAIDAGIGGINIGWDLLTEKPGQEIGPNGGTLTFNDGIKVKIPRGCLTSTITITAAKTSNTAPSSLTGGVQSFKYSFSPAITFKYPIDVTLDVPVGLQGVETSRTVYWSTNNPTVFERLVTTYNPTTKTITAKVKHFSDGFVGVIIEDPKAATSRLTQMGDYLNIYKRMSM